MKFSVTVGEREKTIELQRQGAAWECRVDGEPRLVDVAEIGPGMFSLLLEGRSFTVSIERFDQQYRVHTKGADLVAAVADPRRWRGRSAGPGLSGRQEITAPMPGRVVRVLVEEGASVEAGQGLLVVEAMKMQNEIPASKQGVVERIRVREGDTVEHGQTLLVVT